MSGGTRLDRLILLLETGSTPSVRLTAARQLGSIAGVRVSHPTTKITGIKSEDVGAVGITNENSNAWRGVEGEWNEVINLVARVLPHLQSKSFETRQAAASALSHISRAVGVWDPSLTAPSLTTTDVDIQEEIPEDYLTLETFDLTNMLEEGGLLLSSSGNEYAKITNLSAEDLAKAQKDALGKLGLGEDDELGVDMGAELASGAEVMSESSTLESDSISATLLSTPFALPPPKFRNDASGSSRLSPLPALSTSYTSEPALVSPTTPQIESTSTPPISTVVATPDAALSARERNKLKRKLKSEGKGGRAISPPIVVPPPKKVKITDSKPSIPVSTTPLNSTTPLPEVKIENVEPSLTGVSGEVVIIDPGAKSREGGEVKVEAIDVKKETEVVVGEWPWRRTVEKLASGLLSSKWETRHGSALGLKEILRLQGSGGGQIAGLSLASNAKRHQQWCDNLSSKLLCVFALDRFGDYISDQTVAPVRETAAQALATLLPYMPTASVQLVQQILIAMIDQNGAPPSKGLDIKYDTKLTNKTASTESRKGQYAWQVRHSGLLGLKYLVAVKGQLLRGGEDVNKIKEMKSEDVEMISVSDTMMLKGVIDAALIGLRDRDDDVRSAAASTLTPIADALVHQLPQELQLVVEVLWDCLADLQDDLSSSIGGVMDLLAKLLVFPAVLSLMQSSALGSSLSDLIPRLFPFFRHTISSVRLAVLNTVIVFLQLPSIDHSWADSRLLRLLFQNFVVEERLEIRNATMAAWKQCLQFAETDSSRLDRDAAPFIQAWFSILMTPVGIAIQPAYFWSAKVSLSGQGGYVHNVDKAMLAQDLSLVSIESIMRCRVAGASALGSLIAIWQESNRQSTFGNILLGPDGLASTSSFRRFLSATVIEELAAVLTSASGTLSPLSSPFTDTLSKDLVALLQAGPPPIYDEMGLVIQRIQADCQALYTAIASQGKLSASLIPILPNTFRIEHAQQVVESFPRLLGKFDEALRKRHHTTLETRLRKLTTAIGYYETTKSNRDRQVSAALGGGVIALGVLPQKLTPLIQSITNSLKREEDVDLQARSARSIAAFIDLNSINTPVPEDGKPVKPRPSDKLVKNLCTFLCQDISRTPIFADTKNSKRGILTLEYKPARGLALKEIKESVESDDIMAARLVYRGAQLALSELALRFGSRLLDRVPKLWSCMSEVLLQVFSSGDIKAADSLLAADDNLGQDLLDCLTVLPTGASKLGEGLHGRLVELFPALALATQSRFAVVRYAVARCFASLCDILPVEGLRHLVEVVIPVMSDPINVDNRRGAVELVSHIVELLDIKILPYVIFLVVPILGRMSDSDDDVRLVATNTFATLIKLVPLEAGLPDPPGFSPDLLAKRQAEREFLTQLLDGSKVEEYQIPIPIAIELRKYQRDGVSWLAFLAKYQLHGLLCDDMGLGKTLQSICILASKHFERSEVHRNTKSVDSVHLPSLVVCPPTLTGHWKHEIKTYASNLKCLIYTGVKAERERLVSSLLKYDVVIMSYDIVRNDIESLGQQDWHYCILDEGHIIKNGQTKLTKAVKSLRAIHRLILSGTPIQNNVLELWSLFDFLMPGFLGSEKAFNTRFGKPIAASRDAKSSSKEQEAGALALEALHKQVLPFLLRRLKEDVLDDLPPKIIQDYYCELSPLQKQLYDDFSTSQAKQAVDGEISSGSGEGKPQHVFQALQYLRKLVNHPVLVIKPDSPQHQAIVAKIENGGGSVRDVENAPKLQALRQILLDCGIGTPPVENDTSPDAVSQHRVLIFCQLKQMLDIIENDLFKTLMPSATYMRMDGGTDVSKRHAVVQTFNGDPSIDCLLLTTHVGGLGLNLTGADTVIFVEHDWNPMKDLQAMDRAHRLGQKKVVNVYRLIMRGTLEEKIMGLQRFKLNIASSVVTQQNSDLASLGTDQILDLFNVSAVDAPAIVSKDRPSGQKAILEGLGDLQAEDEYKDLDFESFASSL